MAKSRYSFEKREREKAKRQKQTEKSAQRVAAKKAKTASETVMVKTDAAAAYPEADAGHMAENEKDNSERG